VATGLSAVAVGVIPVSSRGFGLLADFLVPSVGDLRRTTGVEAAVCDTFVPLPFFLSRKTVVAIPPISSTYIGDAPASGLGAASGLSKRRVCPSKSARRGNHDAERTVSSTIGIWFGWTQLIPNVHGQCGQ
jgi:hypothetical protein